MIFITSRNLCAPGHMLPCSGLNVIIYIKQMAWIDDIFTLYIRLSFNNLLISAKLHKQAISE